MEKHAYIGELLAGIIYLLWALFGALQAFSCLVLVPQYSRIRNDEPVHRDVGRPLRSQHHRLTRDDLARLLPTHFLSKLDLQTRDRRGCSG